MRVGSMFATENFFPQTRFTPTAKIIIEPVSPIASIDAWLRRGPIRNARSVTSP